ELIQISEAAPFRNDVKNIERGAIMVYFLKQSPAKDLQKKLDALRTDVIDFHVGKREVYWLTQRGLRESLTLMTKLERVIGIVTTNRNITTVDKLAQNHCVVR